MPTLPQLLLPAPEGMASSMSSGSLPLNRARLLEGMLPARLGVQKPAPLPKLLCTIVPKNAGEQIQGYAIYRPQFTLLQGFFPVADLLIFTDRNLYILPIGSDVAAPGLGFPFDYAYLSYDESERGQRCHLQYVHGPLGLQYASRSFISFDFNSGDWHTDVAAGEMHSMAAVQFGNELLFCAQGPQVSGAQGSRNLMWRYYRDPIFTQHLYAMYIPAGGAPTINVIQPGTQNGIYQYAWTWVDELGRESSPSDPLITPSLTNQECSIRRGTTTTGTSLVVQTATGGWRLYRHNPGPGPFNLVSNLGPFGADPLPFGSTSFIDLSDDATVDLQPVMPSFGENDPPEQATFLTVHKNRVVLNNAVDFNVVQISNANSATQFSSITLPTDTAAGLRLAPGDDADDIITGLESIGDFLWIAKANTYYLLQGDNITNWNVQQIYKNRGCQNPFTVQRTEESIMFLSSDGVYALSYQAGMISPKISWEIDDILNGFAGVLTPNEAQPFGGVFTPSGLNGDGNSAGRPRASQSLHAYMDFVMSYYLDQRFFLCLTDRTIGYDLLSNGWFDAGFGPIKWPVTYSGVVPWNASGFPVSSLPDAVFFSKGGAYSGNLDVFYYLSTDTAQDVDRVSGGPWTGTVVTRDFDAPSQQNARRGARYSIYGTTGQRRGTKLGSLTFFSGGKKVGPTVPILANQCTTKYNALFEQGLPSSMTGEKVYVREEWTNRDVEITERVMEFTQLA